jgi:uncharacterized protein (DUF1501 family)
MMETDSPWFFCDGRGGDGVPTVRPTRRALLGGTLAAALTAWAGRSALAQVSVDRKADAGGDVLITLFLRGGADCLSLIVPHGDDDYYRARPTLALARPRDRKNGAAAATIDLDGFFALHPALAPLHPLYADGTMAVVHAVGSQDQTRSHFEAMMTMERGLPDDRASAASGWIARYLAATPSDIPSPLRAIAWGTVLPDVLRGATDVSVLASLNDFRLKTPPRSGDAAKRLPAALAALYKHGDDSVARAGRETLAVLEALRRVDPAHYQPENGAAYPQSDLGSGLRQVACLLKADVGLEVACLDRGGWDSHVGQGGATGWLALQAKDVADSLTAFTRDLGSAHLGRVTIAVFTEFGRRVAENGGLGTDHGRGGAMLLLGGSVNGGKVYGKWPGLAPDQLEAPGDLRVTTDYRAVFAEIAHRRLRPGVAATTLFPGLPSDAPTLGIVRS